MHFRMQYAKYVGIRAIVIRLQRLNQSLNLPEGRPDYEVCK